MSLFYTVAYWIGVTPWESLAAREAPRISAMFGVEEQERHPPYGLALDVGCGTGMQSVELARRGWQVTGIEINRRALRAACERVRAAGIEVKLVAGDVTALRAAGVGPGFQFVLDFGLFHGLTDREREAMGREISAVTVSGATMLIVAWAPGRRGPLPRGASRADIEIAFPRWKIIDEIDLSPSALPWGLKNSRPRFYRLRRD
jgi:SAM-dependent methyltransferase